MNLLVNNQYKIEDVDKKMQNEFWKIYKENISRNENLNKLHGKLKAKISINFLKKNEHLLK